METKKYDLMVMYLNYIEKKLYKLVIIKHEKRKYKIYYTINTESFLFDIKYIEDIYNDYSKVYNFSYMYKNQNIENGIIYTFEIVFK